MYTLGRNKTVSQNCVGNVRPVGKKLESDDTSTKIQEFFESDSDPWESRYAGNSLEANMYHDRQRAALQQILRHCKSGGRVLEVGCGTGILSRQLIEAGFDVTCCDFSLRMIKEAQRTTGNNRLVIADACLLPFKPHVFDCIVLIGVAAYISDLDKMLGSLRTILKSKGKLVISSANKRMLLSLIGQKLSTPLYRFGLKKPQQDPNRRFFVATNRYFRADDFNMSVSNCGFELLQSSNVGFGRIRIGSHVVLPDIINIALSRFLSVASRLWSLRWMSNFAFNNIACFRICV